MGTTAMNNCSSSTKGQTVATKAPQPYEYPYPNKLQRGFSNSGWDSKPAQKDGRATQQKK